MQRRGSDGWQEDERAGRQEAKRENKAIVIVENKHTHVNLNTNFHAHKHTRTPRTYKNNLSAIKDIISS